VKGKAMETEDTENEQVDALCKECGHAFKAYIDRVVPEEKKKEDKQPLTCPVCGCGDCRIGK
jgi:hypothetical protein